MDIADGVPLSEFAARRSKLLRALEGAAAVVFAGDGAPPLSGVWEPDWNFYYLTGIRNEAGAAVLFDPRSEDPRRRCILFLRPLNPEAEQWDGFRDPVTAHLKAQTGFETVLRTNYLPRTLSAVARKRGRLACLHPFANYDAPVSHDLAIFRKVAERCVGVSIQDRTQLLPRMRAVKSVAELGRLRAAVTATARGFDAALRAIRPGVTERAVQREMESAFIDGGADGAAYNSIVGSGRSGTVLHYMSSSGTCAAGDLIVIDAAARIGRYCADVTRTFPASGRFTPEQREVYTIVLRALEAGIRAARPGVHMAAVDAAARAVIEKAGYGDYFPHGIGHPIGLEVHDVTPDGPLLPGMVVTVEPGIYLPDKGLGVRIEDDILITRQGPKNLTASIPRTVAAIEAAMKHKR